MTNVAIFGAYSAIAEATARRLTRPDGRFFLVGRDTAKLESVAADLRVRGAEDVQTYAIDLTDREHLADPVEALFATMGRVDAVLLAHGTLPRQADCQGDAARTFAAFEENALSHIGLLTLLGERFEQQGEGTIAVITSVAGDRGRKSNYVYGSAKRALTTFLEGLRHRLAASGVTVLDIRPGFVDTPMTDAFRKGPLWAKPDRVATDIVRAIERGRAVVYTPWYWRYIMLAVRNLPRAVFNRLNL